MGVGVGLEAEGPVLVGVEVSPVSLTELCQLTSELGELMLGVWIAVRVGTQLWDEIRYLLSGILGVVGLIQQFAHLA